MTRAGSVSEVTSCVVRGEAFVRKRVARHVADSPVARAALVREASFLALATHPAVPRAIEVGTDDDGPFLVEEAIQGVTLAELSSAWHDRVPRLLALHVVREAAGNLSAIHGLADERGPLELAHG